MENNRFFHWQENTLLLKVYLQPGASKDEIVGPHHDSLKIRITTPPIDGKANRHLQKFLAKIFSTAPSKVVLLAGKSSRSKQFAIENPRSLPDFIPTKK